jgi:hypothetical protein
MTALTAAEEELPSALAVFNQNEVRSSNDVS